MVDILKKYILMAASGIMLLACGEEETVLPSSSEVSSDIYAMSRKPRMADGIDDADESDPSGPIYYDQFAPGSLLYFSQMPQGGSPNFINETESANSYMYVYQYYNTDATWEDGYNFRNYGERLEFDWERVLNIGPDGNAFKFFAFHFPVANTPVWSVKADQTGGETTPFDTSNFLESDIMGAFHSTSSIFTRMRFRLFHLMTYVKVTLYVPVFNGTSSDYENQEYSGFLPDALIGAYVINAYRDFNIDWSAAKSSDTEAPLVQIPANATKGNIKMYRHDTDNTTISEINVTEYFDGKVDGIDGDTDEVRTYEFSVLFPAQNFGSDNFMCFALRTPGNDIKYYYFSGGQTIGADGSSYGLTQGTLQQLYLYVPRQTNKTILVGARVLPWNDAVTDMTVNKKQEETD